MEKMLLRIVSIWRYDYLKVRSFTFPPILTTVNVSASLAFTESIFIASVEDSDLIKAAKDLKATNPLQFPSVVEAHID
jgi:hypothetical protein